MGILRVDKLSGLETPTPVTGSVNFDGNDHLEIGAAGDFNFLHNGATDWTAEFWVKTADTSRQFAFGTGASSAQTGFSLTIMSTDDNQADGEGVYAQFGRGSSGNYRYWGSNEGLSLNTWHHIAAVFKTSDKTLVLYVDGREVDSGTGTANGTFATTDYASGDSSFPFIVAKNEHGDTYLTGEISNLRVVGGRRLYTSNFTPPVHALESINGTRILCCNNPDSVTAFSNAGIGTVRTVATGGDPTVATVNPGLARDFTSGTEFRGVTTFDTQGYFVPPSGTTEQRGRGRGLFGGGKDPAGRTNSIDFIQIQTQGNAQNFGDLTLERESLAAAANATRGLFAGGDPGTDVINFVTIASTGDAIDFGDLVAAEQDLGGAANNTRGLFFGGSPGDNTIQYVTISSLGDAQDFGDLTRSERDQKGGGSPTRCIIILKDYSIDFVTFSTLGNAQEFGNTTGDNSGTSACSDSTRLIRGGGTGSQTGIEYLTIATTGNGQDFGDLTLGRSELHAVSNSIRGVFGGGDNPSPYTNTIDYVTIQTTGNAQDFGDLAVPRHDGAGSSDSHGGIS